MLQPVPDKKIFGPAGLVLATLLGGPIAAAYVMTRNTRALGHDKYNGIIWLLSFFTLAGIVVLVYYYPFTRHFPWYFFLLNLFNAWWLVRQFQPFIPSHVYHGGQLFSIWHALFAGIISFILSFLVVFLALFFHDLSNYMDQNP